MYTELVEIFHDATNNADIKAVVITGTGTRAFCAGSDASRGFNPTLQGKSGHGTFHDPVGRFISTVIAFPKPLVAVVNGLAVGLGFSLLAHCDMVFATENATFAMPMVRVGVIPGFCSTFTLPHLLPRSMATEILCWGRTVTAFELQQVGFLTIIPAAADAPPPPPLYSIVLPYFQHYSVNELVTMKQLSRPSSTIQHLLQVHRAEMSMQDELLMGKL